MVDLPVCTGEAPLSTEPRTLFSEGSSSREAELSSVLVLSSLIRIHAMRVHVTIATHFSLIQGCDTPLTAVVGWYHVGMPGGLTV
jgi:hypothetical protein